MLSSQKDQMPSKPIELAFLRDFKEALAVVKEALESKRGFYFILVGISLLQIAAAATDRGTVILDWMMEAATLYVASIVIVRAYKKLMPDFDETQVKSNSEKRIIAASVSFGLGSALLGLLFLLPGIWFAANACLAAVFACLENCNAGDSIKRSQELVKGHFMTALIYAVFKPFLVWTAMISVYLTVACACKFLLPNLERYMLPVVEGAMSFCNAMFQLAVFALLVRLYAKLKDPNGSMVSSVVPSASQSSTLAPMSTPLHEIDDSKLNPRW
jgi:hypothetical protein